MSASKVETPQAEQRGPFARQRPITAFLIVAFGIGWPALTLPLLAGIPADPFLLALVFLGLLAPAIVVSRIAGGPGAGKRLLLRATMWRFNAGRWALIVLAVPALTIAFAALSGTLSKPEGGVLAETASYLFATFIFGALIVNIWEETAWGGFAQTRLMAQHGLLVGSLLTAPLFAAIHIPLLFAAGWTWSEVGVNFAVLCIGAPFYRYLLGLHLLATGGSILAIGVQHAAWNAAGNIDGIDGDWQSVAAVVLLSVLLAIWQRRSSTRHPVGVEAEKAAAASWIAQGPEGDPIVPFRDRGTHVS
jgi:membrane protease YdiL (CAAX protease family)